MLVLHGGVHEGRVPGHGVTDVLERSGAKVWVRALLQALESLVTAGPVSSLGEDQDLNTGKLFKLSAIAEIRNRQDFDLSLITSIAGKLFPVKTNDSFHSNSFLLISLNVTKTTYLCHIVYFWRGALLVSKGSIP